MTDFASMGFEFQGWLLRASWQAGVLAVVVLGLQRLLGKRLVPAWRYRLWLLVVARLILPAQPVSTTSIHNLARLPGRTPEPVRALTIPAFPEVGIQDRLLSERRVARGPEIYTDRTVEERSAATEVTATAAVGKPEPMAREEASLERVPVNLGKVLIWIWAAGVLVFGLRMAGQNLWFRWRLRRDATRVSDPVREQLELCREALRVRRPIRALETALVRSPAVFGLWRATLLLPRGLASEFSAEELRYVLLHELAHVKRWDTAMTWLLAGLQVLHWFNPLLWYAFARIRVDRELACDALVLSSTREDETGRYGETIIRLLEVMNRGGGIPGLVGVLEDREQIRERIRMIAAFRRPGRASALAAALVIGLGWVGLTDAAPGVKPLPPVVPLTLTNLLSEGENKPFVSEAMWKAPPRGSNVFGGIEFHIDGLIQLSGTGPEGQGRRYRERVVISLVETNGVGAKARVIERGTNLGALHFVGGTSFDAPSEAKVAEVVWRYTDGTFKRTPIRYGVQVRDWWRAPHETPARLPGPHAKVVWRGNHPEVSRWGKSMRLYRVSLANPEPKRTVRQLEWVSARSRASLFIAAMTLDPLKPGERPDDTPDLEETDPEMTGHMAVTVQDEAGQPLAGAEVRVQFRENGKGMGLTEPRNVFTTDAAGFADVLRPVDNLEHLQIRVSKENFGARKVAWDVKTGDVIPLSHTVRMKSAIRIGGKVVDPDGNPLQGATVTLTRFWRGGERVPVKGAESDFPSQTHTTDVEGRWAARDIPPELLPRIGIQAQHADYVSVSDFGDRDESAAKSLREETHTITLGRGLEARGRVLDDQDAPIAGARVWIGNRDTRERKDTLTEVDGRFGFRNVKEGRTLFSVLAKGRQPSTQTTKIEAGMAEVVFKLGAGAVIRARVQNGSGEALAGTRVVLEGNGEIGRTFEFSTTTDDDGRFEWDSAPNEPMQFYFYAAGYEQKRDHELKPGEDNVVVMHRSRKVVGKVVDETSGEPVNRFRLGVGHAPGGNLGQFYVDHPGLVEHTAAGGAFEIDIGEEQNNALQVEADEYAGVTELLPKQEEGEINVVVKLKGSPSLRGVVLSADGRPAAGARLLIIPRNSGPGFTDVQFSRGRLEARGRTPVVEADEEGRFVLAAPTAGRSSFTPEGFPILPGARGGEVGDGMVIAAGADGFAAVPAGVVRQEGRLVLRPYGRIEGSLTVLGEPAVGEEFVLGLGGIGLHADFNSYKATTDAQGRFALENVPAGEVTVVRLVRMGPGTWRHALETSVTVESGQTARVDLGGTGAVVRGRVRFETPLPAGEDYFTSGEMVPPPPEIPPGSTEEQVRAIVESPEWRARMKAAQSHAVRVNSDGTFLVDSIAPGTYTLTMTVSVPGVQPWESKPVATGEVSVSIPADAKPGTPVVLGEIVLKPVTK